MNYVAPGSARQVRRSFSHVITWLIQVKQNSTWLCRAEYNSINPNTEQRNTSYRFCRLLRHSVRKLGGLVHPFTPRGSM